MKNKYYTAFFTSMIFLIFSCIKENIHSGTDCRPLQMVDNNSGTQYFEYDEVGMIKSVANVRHGHTTRSLIIRDENGLIIESFKYYDNTMKNKYSYTYDSGHIIKIDMSLPFKTTSSGSYHLKYDSYGRIIEIHPSFPVPIENIISSFQYNSQGECVQYDRKLNEQVFYSKRNTYSGTPIKAFTFHLIAHGLPLDINEWTIYPEYQESEGSTTKVYSIQANSSSLDLVETSIIKSILWTAGGSISEVVMSDEQGIVQNKVS